ncbi:hypothetical protein [Flavobacterium aurantiibacter]|uniref:Uncharacterized protein n=1 Tax=Flavobacterium aurantiibacter TaxID=2023067 RepID=A0A256A5Q7_9FLAO|nr:hypothetical protein [Flavobacterium aurantiibacter]OYQ48465.1 hypothetical protein CHX27_02250 [Flavobacterium aurantiibacter]
MKKVLAFLVCFIGFFSIAQTTTITHLLQKTLQQENKARQMLRAEADGVNNEISYIQQDLDSLEVAELTIKNDTLFYTTKQKFAYENGYYLEQQIVALKDITAVTKDIGIFFESRPDKVRIVRQEYFEDGNYIKTNRKVDLFRTYFVSLRKNEYFAKDLVKAFKKAGYTIEKGYWFE